LDSTLDGKEMTTKPIVSLEIINFRQELERIEREVLEEANEDIEDLIHLATSKLRIVTPVDTGEARMGWVDIIEKNRLGGLTGGFIINEVEHIGALNFGHSQQAPKYFIEQVLVTIGVITPA